MVYAAWSYDAGGRVVMYAEGPDRRVLRRMLRECGLRGKVSARRRASGGAVP